jgi:hypothetical protein
MADRGQEGVHAGHRLYRPQNSHLGGRAPRRSLLSNGTTTPALLRRATLPPRLLLQAVWPSAYLRNPHLPRPQVPPSSRLAAPAAGTIVGAMLLGVAGNKDNTGMASDCLDILAEAAAAYGPHLQAMHAELLKVSAGAGNGLSAPARPLARRRPPGGQQCKRKGHFAAPRARANASRTGRADRRLQRAPPPSPRPSWS